MEINKTQFKKWIAALDSGEFKQGTGALQDGQKYCCSLFSLFFLISSSLWFGEISDPESKGSHQSLNPQKKSTTHHSKNPKTLRMDGWGATPMFAGACRNWGFAEVLPGGFDFFVFAFASGFV